MIILKIMKLSLRAIIRDRRRSIILFFVTFLSFIIMALYMGYIKSFKELFTSSSIYGDYGHIQIFKADTPRDVIESGIGSYDYMISGEDFLKAKEICRGMLEVMYVAPRINISGIAASSGSSKRFNGDAINASDLINLYSYFPVEGGLISDDNVDDIVIGKLFAKEIGVKNGDMVLLTTTSARGSIEAVNVRVAGLYSMGSKSYDRFKFYMNIKTARRLMLTDSVSKLIVLLDSDDAMYNVQNKLNRIFKEKGLDLKAYNFYQTALFIVQLFEFYDNQVNVAVIILSIVIFFSLLNSLYLSITDKTSEFSTMRTLGISRSVLFATIVTEGLMLILLSLFLGIVLLKPTSSFINSFNIQLTAIGSTSSFPLFITPDYLSAIKVSLIYFIAGIVGAAVPAAGIIRLNIARGLKKE